MAPRLRTAFLLVLFIPTTTYPASSVPERINEPISVCDLIKPAPFLGKLVSIKARMLFTPHGGYLLAESCSHKVKKYADDVALLWPGTENAPKVQFNIDSHANQMLGPFLRPNGGTATACATLTGQVFYKRFFYLHQYGAGPQGNGYGSRGALRRGFVIQSIIEIQPC
jgi:hypothetical protein